MIVGLSNIDDSYYTYPMLIIFVEKYRHAHQAHEQFHNYSYLKNSSCIRSVTTHPFIWLQKSFARDFLAKENGTPANHFISFFDQTVSLRSTANLPTMRF
jgi:hypothetical protein